MDGKELTRCESPLRAGQAPLYQSYSPPYPPTPPSARVHVRFLKSITVPAKKEEGMKFLTVSALRGHHWNLKNDLFVKEGQKTARENVGGLGGTRGWSGWQL